MDIKVKDLIKILQGCNPEDSVIFSIGEDDDAMLDICKASIVNFINSRCMEIESIKIVQMGEENNYDIKAFISIGPKDWGKVIDDSKKFNDMYIKK